jgi:hypothetical protein
VCRHLTKEQRVTTEPVNYNTYYSLFMQSNVNLYLSWSSLYYYAYLYDVPKALWFDRASGSNSGQVQTGDVLQITCHLVTPGMKLSLSSYGLDKKAEWAQLDASCNWTIWKGTGQEKGQPINLNDSVYFVSQAYPNNALIQFLPSYPSYLSTGPTTVPYQFQILDEDGSSTLRVRRPAPPDATAS